MHPRVELFHKIVQAQANQILGQLVKSKMSQPVSIPRQLEE